MKKTNKKTLVELGIGTVLTAAAAALAGSYFVYGKGAKKNRKSVKSWALKAKAEVLEQLEKAKEISEPIYNQAVDKISKKYSDLKNIDKKDVEALVKELKTHWKDIKKEVTAMQKPDKKSINPTQVKK